MVKNNKILSLLCILAMYVVAFIGGFFSSVWIDNIYLQLLFWDVIATIIIWIFSLIVKNSSVYDPYWSFAPWILLTYLMIKFNFYDLWFIIVYASFSVWSFRLTINWIITFDNLTWEDWRYKRYRETLSKPLFHLANFFGIQMMPTLLVFAGTLPLFFASYLQLSSPLMLIGAGVILLGTLLEFFADHQMHDFLRNTKEKKTCQNGLWNYSRHPNYLGEVLIWVGAYLVLLVANINLWWIGFGFILMILLFEFISIPMAEKRHKSRRNDYIDYIKSTNRLLILPKRKI
jgi:steroid 5-alpha reductase family enzyme